MKVTLVYDPPIHHLILTPGDDKEADDLHRFADSPSPITTEFHKSADSKYQVLEIKKHKS